MTRWTPTALKGPYHFKDLRPSYTRRETGMWPDIPSEEDLMRAVRAANLGVLVDRVEDSVISDGARAALLGKRVLVTGAGGSIGSELCLQLKACHPNFIYALDHDESSLHRLGLRMSGNVLRDDGCLVLADIRDRSRIMQIFAQLRPEIVFHAAAHKHLAFMERNPCEGVKSNVFGTKHVVEAASQHLVERFILISTDKAADPTSVLGATKRLAELIVQGYSGDAMACASVRFGNVLGSRGSLLEVVSTQLGLGIPLTLTHPDASRFFMTVDEAVGFVLEATRLASGGEVFVFDTGEAIRIVDVVKRFVKQLGLTEVEVEYSGLRAGEKIHETLFSAREEPVPTDIARVLMAVSQEKVADFEERIEDLQSVTAADDQDAVRSALTWLVPEYTPAVHPNQGESICR